MKEQMNLSSVLSISHSGCKNQMMDTVAPDCLFAFFFGSLLFICSSVFEETANSMLLCFMTFASFQPMESSCRKFSDESYRKAWVLLSILSSLIGWGSSLAPTWTGQPFPTQSWLWPDSSYWVCLLARWSLFGFRYRYLFLSCLQP